MRLLHFDQTGRLILTNFSGKLLPPYAVLSHRWGNDEVLFQDLAKDDYKSKAGYRKIEFCAKLVAQDQLQYFWIDTCCIDKWNLHELSNAINSMFRWYGNAAKCYVFLSDVSVSPETEAQQQSIWEASFRASKWFTRGWTLQELIAPKSVEFFSVEGHRLGDKESLEKLVQEITSIPVPALHNCPLENFSVPDRMTWAKNRETTEPEDNIYCLLGILDVNMSISYNEGKAHALRRLKDDLEATSTAPSIIPFSRNLQFVGRESELAELEAKFFGLKTTTYAIIGMGGAGKSQLALELAYRTKCKDNNCSVFWIDANDIDSLHQAYSNIAQKLNIAGWDDEKTDVQQLVKLYLSTRTAGKWLLIFDNVDNVSLQSTGLSTPRSSNLIDYLPQSELGSIVLTTTNSDIVKTLGVQRIVELRDMTPISAQRMLENFLTTPGPDSEEIEMKLLLEELSYLPLAIVQAAAYININNITFKDYRTLLAEQNRVVLELSDDLSDDELQDCEIQNPVTITLLVSLNQIRHDNVLVASKLGLTADHLALAAGNLALAACVDRKDIPLELLVETSECGREGIIRVLDAYALITRRPAESAIDLHRLVHSAARKQIHKQGWLDEFVQMAIRRLFKMFPDDDDGSRSKWRRLLPHAKCALSHVCTEPDEEDRMRLVGKCIMVLLRDGRYDESEELLMQMLETNKMRLGFEHPKTLTTMSNLATVYANQGRWKEAEQIEVQVVKASQTVLGPDHPETLSTMSNLASTYVHLGRWQEGEQLGKQVVEATKIKLGADHPDTLISMGNLASAYKLQGRWDEAEQLEVQTMEAWKMKLGPDHPDTLTSMGNLASTYIHQDRWKDAEELERQVLEIRKSKLGADHPDTLISMANLAACYVQQGQWENAEPLQIQAIKAFETKLGPDHPDTLITTATLAHIYRHQRRWEEAEQLEVQVLEIRKTKLGVDHPDTLNSVHNLAFSLKGLGRDIEAVQTMEDCVRRRTRVFGPEHPHTLSAREALDAWTNESCRLPRPRQRFLGRFSHRFRSEAGSNLR